MAEEERSNITFPIPEWACPIFTTTGKLGVVICEIIEHQSDYSCYVNTSEHWKIPAVKKNGVLGAHSQICEDNVAFMVQKMITEARYLN